MSKFKIGDIVECIRNSTNLPTSDGGCGWKEGFRFKITKITGTRESIYWKGSYNAGVFESYLKLVGVSNPNSSIVIKNDKDR